MDENILGDGLGVSESGEVPAESVVSDSESGENAVEFDSDSSVGGGGSDGVESVTESTELTLDSLLDEETGGIPVYLVETGEQESLIDDELGGVPVVITDDVSAVANYAGSGGVSYQLPTYYVDYFAGVLANMGDTDYLSFCTREYSTGGSYNYVEHYLLVYDLDVTGGAVVAGSYPCIDIYRSGSSSNYTVDYGTYSLTSVPDFSYGSFGRYSDLRGGMSHDETWAVLFAIGFAVVYSVCHDIFDYVIERVYRR